AVDRAAHRHVVDVEVVGRDGRVTAEAELEAGLEGGGVRQGARAALPDVQVRAAALPDVHGEPGRPVEVLDVQEVADVGRAGAAVHAQVRPEHHVAGRGVERHALDDAGVAEDVEGGGAGAHVGGGRRHVAGHDGPDGGVGGSGLEVVEERAAVVGVAVLVDAVERIGRAGVHRGVVRLAVRARGHAAARVQV